MSNESLAQLVAELERRQVVPARFIAFCKWLGVTLTPAQELAARVAFDGEDVPDTELGRQLFGFVGPVPEFVRRMVVAVVGRRGGKSYVLISLRLLHLMLTVDVSSAAPGQRPAALVIAPNDKLRQEDVSYALGAVRSHPTLRDMLILPKGTGPEDIVGEFAMRRPDGRIVEFAGAVATVGGYGGRGRALVGVALEEVAFFRDKASKVNDADILKAVRPAVLPGGQIILGSSPFARRGVLWEEHQRNHGHPVNAISIHAPTVLLNPQPWVMDLVAAEYKTDPETARYELGAEFLESGTSIFFDDQLIESCIDDALTAGRMSLPGEMVRAGGDTGLRSDSAALAIAQMSGAIIRVGEILELRPEPDRPLKPSEVAQAFRQRCDAHGVSYYTADGHYWDAILEQMGTIQCAQATGAPHEFFVRARQLMREGRVKLPRNERLIRQLREVEARPLPGGSMAIHMPRWRTGGHGDLAQAVVLAIASFGGQKLPEPGPEPGTTEWDRAKRRKEFNQQRDTFGAARYAKAPWRVR